MSSGALTQGLAGHRPSLAPLRPWSGGHLQHTTYLSCSAQFCSRALATQAPAEWKSSFSQSTEQWHWAVPGSWHSHSLARQVKLSQDWLCWLGQPQGLLWAPTLLPCMVPAAQPSFQKKERITKVCKCFSIYSAIFRNVIASISRTESSHFYQYLKNQFAACNKVHLINTAAFPPNFYVVFYEKFSFSFSFKLETWAIKEVNIIFPIH